MCNKKSKCTDLHCQDIALLHGEEGYLGIQGAFLVKAQKIKMLMRWDRDFEGGSQIQAEFRKLRLLTFIWLISPYLKWSYHYFLAHITFSKICTLNLMRGSMNAKQWESCDLTRQKSLIYFLSFRLLLPFLTPCTNHDDSVYVHLIDPPGTQSEQYLKWLYCQQEIILSVLFFYIPAWGNSGLSPFFPAIIF